jgi:hypothetical protein
MKDRKRDFTTDVSNIKKVIKDYFEQMHIST